MVSALALFARIYLQPVTGQKAPFVTFYFAVALTLWLAGTGPGILATSVGAVAGLYFLEVDARNLSLISSGDLVTFGGYITVCASFIYVVDAQNRAKTSLVREVAARREAERREAEQHEWYETTLRSIGDAVIATDHLGRVKFLNSVAERLTGYSSAEAIGLPVASVFVVQREGQRTPMENPVAQVIREGRAIEGTDHVVLLDKAGVPIPIDDTAAPIRSANGVLAGVVLVFRDITLRRESERALAQHLADMEQFAYVASHDLQEPLRSISIFTTMLERGYRQVLDGKALDYMRFIIEGTQRMQQLISDLLEYSRANASALTIERVPLDDVLNEALEGVRGQIELSGAAVTREALPSVYGDRVKLRLVLQNLVSNALKFHGEQPCEIHVWAERQQGAWMICVRDNGQGFEQIYAKQIFGMFRRLSPGQQCPGSGIGLAICKRIVEHHQGHIWAESEPGKGATFRFTIPYTAARAASEAES